MRASPLTREVSAALAAIYHGGAGPSHTSLARSFVENGYGEADPYDLSRGMPNKEQRVLAVTGAAMRRPDRARDLIESLLTDIRIGDHHLDSGGVVTRQAAALQSAFRRAGWQLSDECTLAPIGVIDLATGGRRALEEQIERLRRGTDDPGLLLGSAKDMLEATAKFALEELAISMSPKSSFDHLWYLARERLGLLPVQVDASTAAGKALRAILQSSWTIAAQVNVLRGVEGTGHGRTLPTGVSPEHAMLVVREACSVAQLLLASLDRQLGTTRLREAG